MIKTKLPHYEIVDRDPFKQFTCREFWLPAFESPYHQHLEIEITGITASEGFLHVGGEVTTFKPGECFLLGPKLPHKFHNPQPGQSKEDWARSLVLHFEESCLGEDFFQLPELEKAKNVLANSSRGLRFSKQSSKAAIRILWELNKSRGIHRLTLFLELLECLANDDAAEFLTPVTHLPYTTHSTNRIDRVTRYVYDHLDSKITLEEIARICDMNTSSFSRFFKAATGRTLTSFISEIRFRESCRLLKQTEHSVTDIAFECGYESLSTFNRQFRRFSNLSPRDYRKDSLKQELVC
ncbi:helix-turn-helix domain-containing protein [Pelagicoccus mobilis]|uniref:Helix-turn-helix domain-containing protein n=1 Tax=Pelagicoccus mobilis TaxID=415221 RepID=A0A934S501_9BACT|nr:AraC family transcriptional regulator [Pelagicoccus mobilis]MBK1879093.1 helix-turn-helix domain-containing protein [Pelagicoccus mobilis]